MNDTFLALGANLGDSRHTIEMACRQLAAEIGEISAIAPFYRTAPLNPPELSLKSQPDFINTVICCKSDLKPIEILKKILAIEKSLGRDRKQELRWGPRKIDIDLLAAGDLISETKELTLPHPQLAYRDFVLVPWCDIAPDFIVPTLSKTVKELKYELENSSAEKFVHEKLG